MIRLWVLRPDRLATMPSTVPTTPATTTGTMPSSSVGRAPQIRRLRMSRPCPSVPRRCPGLPTASSRSLIEPVVGP